MIWEPVVLILLLGFSAFVSGAETALFNLSASQRHQFARAGNRLQRAAAELIQRPDRLILTLMLVNMTVNVAFFAISSVLILRTADRLSGWQSTLLGFAPLLAIVLFGEVLPKALALSVPGAYAATVALPLRALHTLIAPVMSVLQRVLIGPMVRLLAPVNRAQDEPITHEELRALLESSADQGGLDRTTSDLLREVVELSAIKVREIMVPRTDIRAYDINAPRSQLVKLIRRERLGVVPVFDKDLDHVLGMVPSQAVLLNEHVPVRDLIRPVVYAPEIITVDALLKTLRQRGRKTAITVDEYGGTAGLITIEDVVEEIVGELRDADEDQPEPVQQIGPDTYLLAGNLPVRSWAEAFRIPMRAMRVDTLAGLIGASLGRLPGEGDVVKFTNLTLTVKRVRARRVTLIELTREDPERIRAGGAA